MMRKILMVLTLAVIVSTLSMLSGCRSKKEAEEGIFVPASEEYFVLDEAEKNDSGNENKKIDDDNTNARKASDKGKKNEQKSDDESGSNVSPTETKKPSQTSNNGKGSISGGAEDESPFVPATGSGSGSGKNTGDAASGGID